MIPSDLLHSFATGKTFPRSEIESAAWRARLSSDERLSLTEAMLTRLDVLKKAHGPVLQRRDYLRDPEINTLVNTLVIINNPWALRTIGSIKRRLYLTEPAEELYSLAVAGRERDAGGMTGAILMFDMSHGIASFLPYIQRAMWNSFLPSKKMKGEHEAIGSKMQHAGEGEEETWVDRVTETPVAVADRRELRGIFEEAVQELPEQRKPIGRFIVKTYLEEGKMPTKERIAAAHATEISRQRGQRLAVKIVQQMKDYITKEYPDLAEAELAGFGGRGR